MYFRLVSEIGSAFFGRKKYSPMVFEYDKPKITVTIKTQASTTKLPNPQIVICEASCQRHPKEKVVQIFYELLKGIYDKSEKANKGVKELEEKLRRGAISGYSLPHDLLPDYFNAFCAEISKELLSYSSRTYRVLRWVENIDGSNLHFVSSKTSWSFDCEHWNKFPGMFSGEIGIQHGLYSSARINKLVSSVVQSGNSEPLGHELLREALDLRSSYPRSALLIGITAAETGVKECVTVLQTETEWLVQNLPSPDILKIIREYIPKLVKNKTGDNLYFPKETILDPLKKGIQMRNIVAHGGSSSVTPEHLSDIFSAVKDLLWLLDYYSGHCWALQHVSEETKVSRNLAGDTE
jgi:hypothetical protein